MKIVGLITEYNPFHNGHLYHLQKTKEITGADAVIAVMSGNYVQRGAPAIMPKHIRAEVALEAGVPLVLELPVCYACGSAEYFAEGAISILEKLGFIDAICFGSECGDLNILERIASITADEPAEYRAFLQEELKNGLSYPKARQNALKRYTKDEEIDLILSEPNNILGIEYIKALMRRKSGMAVYTIKRRVSGYHDEALSENYSSASAIRRLLWHASNAIHLEGERLYDEPPLSDALTRLEGQVPSACIRMLEETHRTRYPVYANDFSLLLKYQLMCETKESLTQYADVTPDLANRILNRLNDFVTFDQFCDLLKTREVTYTRISRALFHILLHIKKEDMELYRHHDDCGYARILGFRKDAAPLLKHLKRHTEIPLITKLTQQENLDMSAKKMLENEIFASNLYESVITEKFRLPFIHEYQQQLVLI